ncbi:polycystin-1-like protein 2 [Salminus brasiliensis]|uniref:polycystin-1-like protein 2 n=1 Tax=Salminus brasiliensis TaxID=930266 RepID=UPI003B838815
MATHTLSTLLLVVVFSIPAVDGEVDADAPTCPEQQQAFEGSCFQFVDLKLSFFSAQGWCERGGGRLAFIQNDETQQFLEKHLQPELDWWLGLAPTSFNLSQESTVDSLSWLDGTDVSYSNWLGEAFPGAGCGYISKHSGFQWETTSNCSQEFSFICQFESGHSLACADQKATLKCGSGQVIEIDDSFYGRKTPYYCRTRRSETLTSLHHCSWVEVLDLVSVFCNGRQVCEVAADVMSIEEPCPGPGNYLSVKYHCNNEPKISATEAKTSSQKFKRSDGNSSSNDDKSDGNSSSKDDKSDGNSSSKDDKSDRNSSSNSDKSDGNSSSKDDKSDGNSSSKDDKSDGNSSSKDDKSDGNSSSKDDKSDRNSSSKDDKSDGNSSSKDDKSDGNSSSKDDKSDGNSSSKDDKSDGNSSSKDDKSDRNSSSKDDKSDGNSSSKDDKSDGNSSSKDDKSDGNSSSKDDKSDGNSSSKDDKSDGNSSSKDDKSDRNSSSKDDKSDGNSSSKDDKSDGNSSSKDDKSDGNSSSKDDKSDGNSSSKDDKSDRNSSSKDDKSDGNSSSKDDKSDGNSSSKNDKSDGNSSSKDDKSDGNSSSKDDKSDGNSSSKDDKSDGNSSSKDDKSDGNSSSKDDKSDGNSSSKDDKSDGNSSSKDDKSDGNSSSKDDKSDGNSSSKDDKSDGNSSSKDDKSDGNSSSNNDKSNNNSSSNDGSKDKSDSNNQNSNGNSDKSDQQPTDASKDKSENQSNNSKDNQSNSGNGPSNGSSKEDTSKNPSNNNTGSSSTEDTSGKENPSENQANESESTCVTVSTSSAVQIKVTCSNCDPVHADNAVSLHVECADCQKILWYFEDTTKNSALSNSCSKDKGQMLLKQQASNVNTFTVPSATLKATKQNIRVVAYGSKDGKSGYGDFTIPLFEVPTTPLPNSPPTCSIDPPVGDILSPFNITCITADHFCCSDCCSFCLTTLDGDSLYRGSELGMRSLFLPLGDKSRHYSLGLKVTVTNADGHTINTTLFTQVRDAGYDSTIEDLQTLVLRYVTQVQQHGLFSASMLAQMFQPVSVKLNRGLYSGGEKSARRKLREKMLADLCAALSYGKPLSALREAQMTADTVLGLLAQEDELTSNAETQTCCVLNKVSTFVKSMSPSEGDVPVPMMQVATPIVQAASSILKVSANMDNQREITSIIFKITDNIQSALLANKKPNQEPLFLISPLIRLYVNRLLPDELQNRLFSIDHNSSAFRLPFLGPGIQQSEEPVDVRMVSFGMNPFTWSKGDPISGAVGGLSLTRENGSVIPVANLSEEIEVFLPRSEAVDLNSTFLDLSKYSTLAINVTNPNASLVLKLQPSEKTTLQLSLGFQHYPNNTNFKAKMQLPQLGNPPEARYTWVLSPKDVALEEGVYYLLVRHVMEPGVNSSNATVFITSVAAQCKYWDETRTNWSDYGCRVGPRTTPLVTQCLCTHLTFFGSSFFVMPNKVDVTRTAELFATFDKNPVVVCFVGAVFLVYFLTVVWARRKDLQDQVKVKVTVLEDNDPLAEYRYLLAVSTGHRRGASTSSHVTVTLTGTMWESEPHHLTDPDKPVFERGGVDMFLLTTPFSLGELQSIRLWHDHSGKHPAWYVNKVMVQDLETGQKWHFLCSSWLAIDMGECTLDKVFPVATETDLKAFGNLFFMKTAKDLFDGHIWFSVISRPASSKFTRVQRVSCCFSLLLCTMLTGIMFWGIPNDPSEQSIDVGNIKFSWKQVMVGIQSSIIMFPVNLLIVSIFRLTRPRKKIQEETSDQSPKLGSAQQKNKHSDISPQWCAQTDITVEFVIKDIKRILRSLAKAAKCPISKAELESNRTDINTLLSLVEDIIRQQNFTLGRFDIEDTQKNLFAVYTVYRQHLHKQLQNLEKELRLVGPSQFSKPEGYSQAVLQVQRMKGLLEPYLSSSSIKLQVTCISSPAVGSSGGSKKCCQKGLPWWFVFVGWFLVAATSGVSAYFTMMYGLTYGKERSISWLISLMVSFFQSLLLIQPVKVLGFAVFFALVVKSVGDDDDDNDYICMLKNKVPAYSGDPDDVRISRRDSTCSFYQPPPPSDIGKIKDSMVKDQKAFAIITEILIYLGFFSMLLTAAYGQRDPNAFFLTRHIQQTFGNGISDSMSHEDVFTWANTTLLTNLFGQHSGFITDGNSKLVGVARLRQVRVQKNSCRTASSMRLSVPVPDCHASYSWEVEDMGSYGPGWNRWIDGNLSKTLLTPWQYQTQSRLKAHPVWGAVALYRGGGFVVDLGPDQQDASSVLQYLFDNTWLDVFTRAVFVEFTVYNANVNLFCIVTLMFETTAVGAFQYRAELQNVRLFQTKDGTHMLASEVIYFLFILYYMFLQGKLMKQQKWEYFRNKWNILELAIILLSWTAFSVFIKRMVQGNQDLAYYQGHKNQFPSFYETAAADSALGYLTAFVVLLATIKMWHLMRLNSKLNMITSTLQRAWTDISSFIVVIVIMVLAYSIVSNLLFGWKLYTYKTLIDAATAMVSLQLGIFNYEEVLDLNPVLGAFIIGSCITFMTFVVLNLFISVILEAFSQEQRHHKPSEEEEIVDLMLLKICSFLGIKTKKKNEKNH